MAGSTDFQRFLESFHAPRSNRRYADDFDLGALARLQRLERERAERLLIQRLRGRPVDDRVPPALALLGSSDAIEHLREALDDTSGLAKLRVALALDELDADYDPGEILLESLSSGDPSVRGQAAGALADQPKDKAGQPLRDLLGDPSFSARIAAFEALIELYGLADLKAPRFSRLRAIGWRLLSPDAEVYRPAANELRSIATNLDAGRSPPDLGLEKQPGDPEAVDRVIASVQHGPKPPWDDGLDLDAPDTLDRATRHVVECYLLSELHDAVGRDDGRVARALKQLGSALAAGPLKRLAAEGRREG